MSSYVIERDLGYREGYEAGLEASRKICASMYQDGFEEGLKGFRSFGDLEKDIYYHVTKLLAHIGVEDTKVANAFKGYFMAEAKLVNE